MYSIFWNVFLSYSWKQAESSLFGEFIMFNFWKKKKNEHSWSKSIPSMSLYSAALFQVFDLYIGLKGR